MSEQIMVWLAPLAAAATILGTALAIWIWRQPKHDLVAITRRHDGSPDRTVCLLFADGTRSDTSDSFGCIEFPLRFAHTTADLIYADSGRRIRSITLVPVDGSWTIEIITDDE